MLRFLGTDAHPGSMLNPERPSEEKKKNRFQAEVSAPRDVCFDVKLGLHARRERVLWTLVAPAWPLLHVLMHLFGLRRG